MLAQVRVLVPQVEYDDNMQHAECHSLLWVITQLSNAVTAQPASMHATLYNALGVRRTCKVAHAVAWRGRQG